MTNGTRSSALEISLIWWKIADVSLDILHTLLLFFISWGWVFNKTRKAHIVGFCLVIFSWIGLGFWRGWGYCLLTDVHWTIKKHLGQSDLPASFISYFFQKTLNLHLPDSEINTLSYVILIMAIVMSVTLNIRDKLKTKVECNEFA